MLKNKDEVKNMFYELHYSVKEIAEKVKISTSYVTKIIKTDIRYEQEKQYRKNISEIKKKDAHKLFIKKQRERKTIEDNYSIVQSQHRQATSELSKSAYLSNESYRKWNSSVYIYNPNKKRYEFDDNLVRPYAIPKYIKVK